MGEQQEYPLRITRKAEEDLIALERKRERPQILGKGGLGDIKHFSGDAVLGYELFLREEDLDLHSRTVGLEKMLSGKVEGAHLVTFVQWEGETRQTDLSDHGSFGEKCEDLVRKTADLVGRMGGTYVNVHLGDYQPREGLMVSYALGTEGIAAADEEEKYRRIGVAAERIMRLNDYCQKGGMTLVVENDALWTIEKYERGILDDSLSLTSFLGWVPTNVKIMLDEEHLYRSAVFRFFWKDYLKSLLQAENPEIVAREILWKLKSTVENSPREFAQEKIHPFVGEMIRAAGERLFGLHVCGWDFVHDSADLQEALPETSVYDVHLPPRRVIKDILGEGVLLRDKIDHRHTLQTVLATVGPEKFAGLKIILEYARHLKGRKYLLHSRGDELVTQNQDQEFAIAARSIRHLVSSVMQEQSV